MIDEHCMNHPTNNCIEIYISQRDREQKRRKKNVSIYSFDSCQLKRSNWNHRKRNEVNLMWRNDSNLLHFARFCCVFLFFFPYYWWKNRWKIVTSWNCTQQAVQIHNQERKSKNQTQCTHLRFGLRKKNVFFFSFLLLPKR